MERGIAQNDEQKKGVTNGKKRVGIAQISSSV
jgi:hypothetical protein